MDKIITPPNDELRECKCCGKLKPLTMFRKSARGGYTSVCSECVREKYHATHHKRGQDKRIASLNDYSPRELMEELARRGYKGKLTYTRIETIDITNF